MSSNNSSLIGNEVARMIDRAVSTIGRRTSIDHFIKLDYLKV